MGTDISDGYGYRYETNIYSVGRVRGVTTRTLPVTPLTSLTIPNNIILSKILSQFKYFFH